MYFSKKLMKKKALFIYLVFVLLATAYSIRFMNVNQLIEIKCLRNTVELNEISLPEPKKANQELTRALDEEKLTNDYINHKIKESPLIFIGGYARSGTTLMRAILDVHPNVSCGPETKILPTITRFIRDYNKNPNFRNDLEQAGIQTSTVDSALSFFIYHIMENHIRSAKHLCAKDPDIVYYIDYLNRLFPKAKFIFMVRDARAVAYSMVNKLEKVKTFDKMVGYMLTWNNFNVLVSSQCQLVGEKACMVVRYEDLILKTNETLRNVTEFLGVSWTDDFMRHNEFVGNKIAVSESEWSTDQIKNPIYKSSIDEWKRKVNDYDARRIKMISRMLQAFGYEI